MGREQRSIHLWTAPDVEIAHQQLSSYRRGALAVEHVVLVGTGQARRDFLSEHRLRTGVPLDRHFRKHFERGLEAAWSESGRLGRDLWYCRADVDDAEMGRVAAATGKPQPDLQRRGAV